MRSFHGVLHVCPTDDLPCRLTTWHGASVRSLDVEPTRLSVPFGCSFEEARARLVALPRLDCDPDGSFVWIGQEAGANWQVDGLMTDRHGRLWNVQIKGRCPGERLDRLLECFGWPETPLCFQDVPLGIFMTVDEFRHLIRAGTD